MTYESLYAQQPLRALARHIVMEKMLPLDGNGISAASKQYAHLVATSTSEFLLAILWQQLTLTHFPNFHDNHNPREATDTCRTRVSIIVPNIHSLEELNVYADQLQQQQTFGKLLEHCYWHLHYNGQVCEKSLVDYSFIGIEIELIGVAEANADTYMHTHFVAEENAIVSIVAEPNDLQPATITLLQNTYYQTYILTNDDKTLTPEKQLINIRMAQLVNMVYDASIYKRDIYPKDVLNVKSYALPLKTFIRHAPRWRARKAWAKLKDNVKLSNVFCADCFIYKLRSIGCTPETSKGDMQQAVNEHLADLSRSEHARWNVEKLLLGFRPLSPEESYHDEMIFGEEKASWRKKMKVEENVHIDLCSYTTLRRIDYDAVKYDCFLMLAMPSILKR